MDPGFYEIDGLNTRIDKVVGIYQVWTMGTMPFAQFKVAVILTPTGVYQASPNVVVRNSATKCLEYVCGIGGSVGEAVRDAVRMFYGEAKKQAALKELEDADFHWMSNP
jgi:hypothetical protein